MRYKRRRGIYGHQPGVYAMGGTGGAVASDMTIHRSADDRSLGLGSLGDPELPRPGAPEPISGYSRVGCDCDDDDDGRMTVVVPFWVVAMGLGFGIAKLLSK